MYANSPITARAADGGRAACPRGGEESVRGRAGRARGPARPRNIALMVRLQLGGGRGCSIAGPVDSTHKRRPLHGLGQALTRLGLYGRLKRPCVADANWISSSQSCTRCPPRSTSRRAITGRRGACRGGRQSWHPSSGWVCDAGAGDGQLGRTNKAVEALAAAARSPGNNSKSLSSRATCLRRWVEPPRRGPS